MNILITEQQYKILSERTKEFDCNKCEHSWKIEKDDTDPFLCHMCGYDSKKEKYDYKKLEDFWNNYSKQEIEEKWTKKYKRSINCNAPKGFSQRAHCQGRKKRLKESSKNDEYQDHGYDIEGIKIALKVMSDLSETYGKGIPLDFSLREYFLKKKQFISKPILQLYIDVNVKNGKEYKNIQYHTHEISVELLHVFEMLGLYNDEKMTPYYKFYFNERV
jgi:hypothetical protein